MIRKTILVKKKQSAMKVIFNKKRLRLLLKKYSLEEIKQVGFQMIDFALDGMVDKIANKKDKDFTGVVQDSDLYY